jgi:hypothetical protein
MLLNFTCLTCDLPAGFPVGYAASPAYAPNMYHPGANHPAFPTGKVTAPPRAASKPTLVQSVHTFVVCDFLWELIPQPHQGCIYYAGSVAKYFLNGG